MKFYFPLHLNGDNRGCEAIALATTLLLEEPKENLVGLCTNTSLDSKLGLSDRITLVGAPSNNFFKVLFRKLHRIIAPQKTQHMKLVYKQMYDWFIDNISKDGIVLSTGGDMFCYDNNEAVYTAEKCQSKGYKTILWGCSIGEKNLTPEKISCLKKFDLIYARESLTERCLRNLGIENIINYPDPAFWLLPKPCALPNCFENEKEIVGLNISNFIISGSHARFNMVRCLVDYIMEKTDYDLLLIPHVLWANQDDRLTSLKLYDLYKGTKRISILNSNNYNYCQIRYIISHCKYFIGARTHSVISAYSTCVPTIALGYSVKSEGIAKDIGLSDKLVVDCNNINITKILDSFLYLEKNEKAIREHLQNTIPIYVSKLKSLKKDVIKYIGE